MYVRVCIVIHAKVLPGSESSGLPRYKGTKIQRYKDNRIKMQWRVLSAYVGTLVTMLVLHGRSIIEHYKQLSFWRIQQVSLLTVTIVVFNMQSLPPKNSMRFEIEMHSLKGYCGAFPSWKYNSVSWNGYC